MFERFTDGARAVVVDAQSEARSLRHGWIGTEHLLLAVLAQKDAPVTEALGRLGLTHDVTQSLLVAEIGPGQVDDGEALRSIGIDLDAVRGRIEAKFGPGALDRAARRPTGRRPWLRRKRPRCGDPVPGGHIRFMPRAKKSLELALREALAAGSKEITAAHLVLGLMRVDDGLAVRLVTQLGVDPDDVRRAVRDLGRAA